MGVFPVLLDAAPPFLRRSSEIRSLLLTPMGSSTLLCWLHRRFCAPGLSTLIVAPSFRPDAQYRQALHRGCHRVSRVVAADEFDEFLDTLEPSDSILFVDPQCALVDGIDADALAASSLAWPGTAVHLIALDTNAGGTCEWVDVDDRGTIGRIRRFYDEVTWSYASGVAASLVPVPSLLTARGLRFDSLRGLRAALAARGVPARDVTAASHAFDLTEEHELLTMTERVINAAQASMNGSNGQICPGASIHKSARLVGPVVVQDEAVVGEGATIVGPSIIGAGAIVGANALVVQCVVGQQVEITEGSVLRRRVVSSLDATEAPPGSIAPAYDPSRIRAFRSNLQDEPARRRVYPWVKLVVESALAVVALIALLPLMAVVAALIKLESRGPVFFADRREAKGGKNFRCLKFRTMLYGADAMQRDLLASNEVDGPQFKLEKDPRLTRIGRWIRPCSLDELPQLVNVALGQMSLVGPRPSPFRENQTCVPWREGRLSVRPGITGLWQVCRHDRGSGDFHQWIEYDLLYVEHMSALLDLKIVAATIFTLGGKWCVPLRWMIPPRKANRAAA